MTSANLPNPAAYLIYHGQPLTLPPGKVYAFVMAAGGLYKYAENRHMTALVPVAPYEIPGLPPLAPFVRPRQGRIPAHILDTLLAEARRESWDAPTEAAYHLSIVDTRVTVTRPRQAVGAAFVDYVGGGEVEIMMDVHSHHEMAAFFSHTDDRDQAAVFAGRGPFAEVL